MGAHILFHVAFHNHFISLNLMYTCNCVKVNTSKWNVTKGPTRPVFVFWKRRERDTGPSKILLEKILYTSFHSKSCMRNKLCLVVCWVFVAPQSRQLSITATVNPHRGLCRRRRMRKVDTYRKCVLIFNPLYWGGSERSYTAKSQHSSFLSMFSMYLTLPLFLALPEPLCIVVAL